MKSVLISIQPKWVEKIANGQKTIEVRKTRPKLETPFKCYIYATKPKKWFRFSSWGYASDESLWLSNGKVKMCNGFEFWADDKEYEPLCGKVIGEFVCDRICNYECELWNDEAYELIRQFNYDEYGEIEYEHGAENNENCEMLNKACLTWQDIRKYLGQGLNTCYAWHITDLKIYEKPKELSEFKAVCNKVKHYETESKEFFEHCYSCEYLTEKSSCLDSFECGKFISRPPQSWCYVENLGE